MGVCVFPLIRGWTDVNRTTRTNVRLGAVLALVAGAANAGGFLAVGQYTSHMTGVVSSVADNLALGKGTLVVTGIGSYLAFVLGAMTTAILVNWGLRRQLRSAYGIPLLLEAILLLVFGLFGAVMNVMTALLVPITVILLCFMMGLQALQRQWAQKAYGAEKQIGICVSMLATGDECYSKDTSSW